MVYSPLGLVINCKGMQRKYPVSIHNPNNGVAFPCSAAWKKQLPARNALVFNPTIKVLAHTLQMITHLVCNIEQAKLTLTVPTEKLRPRKFKYLD